MHDFEGLQNIAEMFFLRRDAAHRALVRHQPRRGLRHADGAKALVLTDAHDEAQQGIVAFFRRRNRLGQQQHALGIQLHVGEFRPVDLARQQHLAGTRALQRLDDAPGLAGGKKFMGKILHPVFGNTSHQRHDEDIASAGARRQRHRARQLAAARNKSQATHAVSPRRRARHNSCLASARMKSTISPTCAISANCAFAARARSDRDPPAP